MPPEPGKDNANELGTLSKKELSMLIISVSIGIVLCTFAAAIIMGLANPETSIVISGQIDLGAIQTIVFTIVGAGIVTIGITQGSKVVK